jgi:hypothetical protein
MWLRTSGRASLEDGARDPRLAVGWSSPPIRGIIDRWPGLSEERSCHSTAVCPTGGLDSVEHGVGMNEDALRLMAERGTAWTPTLSARFGRERHDQASPEVRRRIEASQERTQELLPLAVRLSVPILTGTDVVGTLPGEVAHLTRFGLNPADAIAAAISWAYRSLRIVPNEPVVLATFVTYQDDPLIDPAGFGVACGGRHGRCEGALTNLSTVMSSLWQTTG